MFPRKTSIGRKTGLMLVAIAVVTATLIGVQEEGAEAAPWGCTTHAQGSGRYSVCTAGGGEQRIAIYCRMWHLASGRAVYGPWMPTAKPSFASCGFGEHIGASYVQGRG